MNRINSGVIWRVSKTKSARLFVREWSMDVTQLFIRLIARPRL
jgi:hypothetical protein